MKLGNERPVVELDSIDLHILRLMQDNCRLPLAKIGDHVGLSAPSVMERIKKLEDSGVITAYRAVLDARLLGQDVTAFIGVSIGHPKTIERFEKAVESLDGVLECHHVTGEHTLLLKVKTWDTSALEELISRIRSIDGVVRTETMVVLSTLTEHTRLALHDGGPGGKRERKSGHGDKPVHLKRA
jgi:Lrp/AsnC family transcriptional regulator, leucine-responsive regulatory protein